MRRFLSVVLYVLGGLMMVNEMMFAFVTGEDMALKLSVVGATAGLSVLLLGLGALISNSGRRMEEVGLTILITAGGALLAAGMAAILINSPDGEIFARGMETEWEEFQALFGAYAAGALNFVILTAIGLVLYRKAQDHALGQEPQN